MDDVRLATGIHVTSPPLLAASSFLFSALNIPAPINLDSARARLLLPSIACHSALAQSSSPEPLSLEERSLVCTDAVVVLVALALLGAAEAHRENAKLFVASRRRAAADLSGVQLLR